MSWVNPTGYNDPDSKWTYETNIYDDNVNSFAIGLMSSAYSWGSFIELTRASIYCSKIRFNAMADPDVYLIDIDIYYDSAWHNLYQGSYTDHTWIEKELDSIQAVTSVRFRFYNDYEGASNAWLYEVDFFEFVQPTVTTQAVTEVDHESGTGNGNITNIGSANPTKRGFCWNITGNPTVADDKVEEEGDFGTGAFTGSITGLDPGVTYYVKAYAYNPAGYAYGSEVDFTTDKVAPTVTTQDPTDVLTTSVTGNGNITATGGENATVRGFKYGFTQTDTWDAHDNGDFGVGAFTKGLVGLDANTEYWIRAYATNSIGTSYGTWVQFQTAASGSTPTGTKISICSDYSGYTFILNESLTDDGNAYESYFVISTDLTDKQGLHFKKRLLDLHSYFENKDSGTCKIYVKRDNEADWQYCGEISMVGDEDIIVKHLPSENQDTSGDVDFLAKHYLIKFFFENDFSFIGLITESVPIGVR